MIRIIIVDDERPAVEELAFLIGQHESVEIIGMFTESRKALEFILKKQPNAVFLDIQMPGMNGFELALEINKKIKDTQIVFVTAFDNYAIKAFEINTVDYVVKPFNEERIHDTIQRLLERQNSIPMPINNIINQTLLDKIAVWDGDHIALIQIEKILFCTLENGEITIQVEEKSYNCKQTLGDLEQKLISHNFFRCHRSYLVNLNKIKQIIPWFNNTFIIRMEGSTIDIPVSRRNTRQLKVLLKL